MNVIAEALNDMNYSVNQFSEWGCNKPKESQKLNKFDNSIMCLIEQRELNMIMVGQNFLTRLLNVLSEWCKI